MISRLINFGEISVRDLDASFFRNGYALLRRKLPKSRKKDAY